MKIEDEKRLIEITMRVWNNGQYSQDLSVGLLVDGSFKHGQGTTYYFYEDFEDDKGVDRAAKHFSDLINKGKVRKAEYIYS